MQLLPFTTEDLSSIHAIQPAGWQDIRPHFEFYLQTGYCKALKLEENGRLIGTGVTILHPEVAWLAHIIVHPAHRNKGLGRGITQALIEGIDRNHYKTISLLATDLGAPIYSSLGFETDTEYIFFVEGNPGDYVQDISIRPFSEEYKTEILRMDEMISGEDRSVRLLPHLNNCSVYIGPEGVRGCYFSGLGEGLIIARDPEAGLALMKLRFKERKEAIFPIDNTTAVKFLQDHGFKDVRKAKRMFLGMKRNWQPAGIYNRVGGQIG